MINPFKRTGVSSLTDEQLLIFDWLFDLRAPWWSLRDEVFSIHANLPFSHNIDDRRLRSLINEWCAKGWLTRWPRTGPIDDDVTFGLTRIGGALWEAERRPQWGRFCSDSESFDRRMNCWKLAVESTQLHIVRAYVSVARACQLHQFKSLDVKVSVKSGSDLIYWKAFRRRYILIVRVVASDERDLGLETDWDEFHRQRTFWRNVKELQTFL